MKRLDEYIISNMLCEHYVDCKKDDMADYADAVWSILQKAYAYCGGIKNVSGPDNLIQTTDTWKLYKDDDEIKAVITYSGRMGGNKICLLGSDETREGKIALKHMIVDEFDINNTNSWVGVSGNMAVTVLKNGAMPIPAEIACEIMGKNCIKCTPYDEYWYERPIKNSDGTVENHYKVMVGKYPGYDTPQAPKELIDKLIQQAKEFGE